MLGLGNFLVELYFRLFLAMAVRKLSLPPTLSCFSPGSSWRTNGADMHLPKLEYSITRPFTLPYFTAIVYTLGVMWIIIITVFNVAAVGYDSYPLYSTSFNSSIRLWYERFVLTKLIFPQSWSCNSVVIEAGQGLFAWVFYLMLRIVYQQWLYFLYS